MFRKALRTNSPQVSSVLFFTAMNLVAATTSDRWWVWLLALLFWPTVAFIANLVNPIPREAL